MSLLVIPFPSIDPVALELPALPLIGTIAIKWYGLAYMAGLLVGWLYIRRLVATPHLWSRGKSTGKAPFSPAASDDLLLYIIVGVLLGGRLGSVLFYDPSYYVQNPLEILYVWRGGMSFHGALLGCGLATWVFSARNGASVWSTMDVCAAAVPFGLFFGRVANFINGELFGRPTDVPWAMVFPRVSEVYPQFQALEPLPRHPSQLYEAALEGVVLFLVLRYLTHTRLALTMPGVTVGTFLVGYGLARSFCELFRQPDPAHALTTGLLTPGIAYSLPLVVLGIVFLFMAQWRYRTSAGGSMA